MLKQILARLVIILGLPLFLVSYIPFNIKQINSLPPNQELLKVKLPIDRAFAKINQLTKNRKYIKAIEYLQQVPQTSQHYRVARELELQLQQKIIETLEACPHGFDSTALKYSSFYKTSAGKYIVQVQCYLSAAQPAYEYYLYTETPTTMSKPLDLTQFKLNYRQVSQEDSNFITGLPEFNQKTQELVVLQKYGDTNDCGTLGKYRFESNVFMLKQFFADFKCGDRKLHYEKIYPHRVGLSQLN